MGFDMNRDELKELLREVVAEAVESYPLSDDEIHLVRRAIKAEADRATLRKAMIEKSITSLFWLAIVAAGVWVVVFMTTLFMAEKLMVLARLVGFNF